MASTYKGRMKDSHSQMCDLSLDGISQKPLAVSKPIDILYIRVVFWFLFVIIIFILPLILLLLIIIIFFLNGVSSDVVYLEVVFLRTFVGRAHPLSTGAETRDKILVRADLVLVLIGIGIGI